MSINQLYEISRRSLRTMNAAINVTGQNLSGAEADGYVRRRLVMNADASRLGGIHTGQAGVNFSGQGVSLQSVDRMRDALFTGARRDATSGQAAASEEHRILSAIELVFPAGETGTLQQLLGGFWNDWEEVANAPTDLGARSALRSRAESLTYTFHQISEGLNGLYAETREQLAGQVDDFNRKLDRVAELNGAISAARGAGSADLSAEDERDRLVDELSAVVPLRAQEEPTGSYTLSVGGMTVLQGETAQRLEFRQGAETPGELLADPLAEPPRVYFEGTDVAFQGPAGRDGTLGALLRSVDRTAPNSIPSTLRDLNTLAAGLVSTVNGLHETGYALDGTTGRPFFEPDAAGASGIRLADGVAADPGRIAASASGAPTDGSHARGIAAMRMAPAVDAETAEGYVINLLTRIGGAVRASETRAQGEQTVMDHLQAMEDSVSRVSIDEEMTNLIRYQQAYGAAARVLKVAEEMMDTLLTL